MKICTMVDVVGCACKSRWGGSTSSAGQLRHDAFRVQFQIEGCLGTALNYHDALRLLRPVVLCSLDKA